MTTICTQSCIVLGIATLLALPPSAPASSQESDWPAHYVRMVVPGGSATAADLAARLIATHLAEPWKQQVVVENRPGAGGMAGTAQIARATPDGYSLLFAQGAPLSLSPHTFESVPYDVERDLAPVVFVGMVPLVLAASPKLQVTTTTDLIAIARKNPGKLTFATSSARSIPHLAADYLMRAANIEMVQVPYVGYPQAIQDTVTGTVDALFGGAQVITQSEGGNLRMLGVSTPTRLPNHDGIPTIGETVPAFEGVAGWLAVMAPKGVPATIIARMNADIRRILDRAEVRARLHDLGIYPDTVKLGDPQALAAFIRRDTALMHQIVKAAGLKPE